MERPPLKIALIAGEVSGDQLGGWLMEAIKKRRPDTVFLGVGGTMMADQGLNSLFPLRDIALMGLAEILPHIRKLSRRIRETVAFLEHEKPDMIITIDSPGFALRVRTWKNSSQAGALCCSQCLGVSSATGESRGRALRPLALPTTV